MRFHWVKDFLSAAIDNIRYNLGDDAVSENELQHLQYNIMKDVSMQLFTSKKICKWKCRPPLFDLRKEMKAPTQFYLLLNLLIYFACTFAQHLT